MHTLTKSIGLEGESVVVKYLEQNNFKILERNYAVKTGEIDIIAKKNNIIYFIEVKTLLNTHISDLDIIINKKKQEKIIKTAKYFLVSHRQYRKLLMSIDVVVLRSHPFLTQDHDIIHIPNAFGDIDA